MTRGDKVTGKAIYTCDVQLPNMAHAKMVRSPHPHARIKSIDMRTAALKLPGVLAVVTAADFPDLTDKVAMMGKACAVHLPHLAANCIAHQKALYKGHAVAAVAATSPHIADEAALLIKVDYEVLPSVTWVLDAMKADDPLLHDEVRTDFMGKKPKRRRTRRFTCSSSKGTSPRASKKPTSSWSWYFRMQICSTSRGHSTYC